MPGQILKHILRHQKFEVQAFVFLPDSKVFPENKWKQWALFTHGYTSHKAVLVNWASKMIEIGTPCVIFDLPGHYLGSYSEIKSFEDFTRYSHELFIEAYNTLKNQLQNLPQKLILGGHSLGAFFSLKALELPIFSSMETQVIAVGFGSPPDHLSHVFDTPLFQKTLELRSQLVSSHIPTNKIFPWLKEQKNNLNLANKNIHLICGKDDIVVGQKGLEGLTQKLDELGNMVTIDQPTKLPHHLPENAAPYIAHFVKRM